MVKLKFIQIITCRLANLLRVSEMEGCLLGTNQIPGNSTEMATAVKDGLCAVCAWKKCFYNLLVFFSYISHSHNYPASQSAPHSMECSVIIKLCLRLSLLSLSVVFICSLSFRGFVYCRNEELEAGWVVHCSTHLLHRPASFDNKSHQLCQVIDSYTLQVSNNIQYMHTIFINRH